MKGKKIAKEVREALLKVIEESTASIKTCCEILKLSERRYYHWKRWKEPGKRVAWNRLRPEETAAILETARNEEQADLRAAGLMVHGQETNKYYCSPSTVQKALKKASLAAPYEPRRRKAAEKPDIRDGLTAPNKVYCYDATDFYTTSGLTVPVVPILDIFSRKNLNSGVYVKSFKQKDVKELWDDTLRNENVDTEKLIILSDNGGQMKGAMTKEHLSGKWLVKLVHSRPHTPDDNPWIEAFIKGLKYHPACPESFETVQDVTEWVNWYREHYNDTPHSALNYVRPNEEHEGLGDGIRQLRKENLKLARKERLAYYYECKAKLEQKESGNRLEVMHNSFAFC
jgi:putative transposase